MLVAKLYGGRAWIVYRLGNVDCLGENKPEGDPVMFSKRLVDSLVSPGRGSVGYSG
jgi:hypothetical protein